MFFRKVIETRKYQSFQLLYLLGCRRVFIEMQSVIWRHEFALLFLLWYSLKYSLLFDDINCRYPFLLWYLLKYSLLIYDINCRHSFLPWYLLKYSLLFYDINCRDPYLLIRSLFHRSRRNDSFCHRYCVYFATVFAAFAAIHLIKQTMFT